MRAELPGHVGQLLDSVPEKDRPYGIELAKFWQEVAYEIAELLIYSSRLERAHVVFNDMRQAGDQYIWEFYVNDLSKPEGSAYNWQCQNTSQWVYAGGIVLQRGKVSTHH